MDARVIDWSEIPYVLSKVLGYYDSNFNQKTRESICLLKYGADLQNIKEVIFPNGMDRRHDRRRLNYVARHSKKEKFNLKELQMTCPDFNPENFNQ